MKDWKMNECAVWEIGVAFSGGGWKLTAPDSPGSERHAAWNG
ncbi:MAG TPA: hypothetical protein VGY91_05535 [Chthoniobacterales bacterium]|nr:hypothetical protein [Chthoniobacterales bacterium]